MVHLIKLLINEIILTIIVKVVWYLLRRLIPGFARFLLNFDFYHLHIRLRLKIRDMIHVVKYGFGPIRRKYRFIGVSEILRMKQDHGFDIHRFLKSMESERERLKSFFHPTRLWRKQHVTPTRLAKYGFFYMMRDDRVQCVFCGGAIQDWELGDNELEEHLKHFPLCPFIKGSKVNNVPIGRDPFGN